MRLCDVTDCERKHKARGLCHMHLARLRRNGSLSTTQRPESLHGTRSRYVHGCRCGECRHASKIYMRIRRLRQVWGPIFDSFMEREAA